MGQSGECGYCFVEGQPKSRWSCPCGKGYWDAVRQVFVPGGRVRNNEAWSRTEYENHLKICTRCHAKAMEDDLICPTKGRPWTKDNYGPNSRPHLECASDSNPKERVVAQKELEHDPRQQQIRSSTVQHQQRLYPSRPGRDSNTDWAPPQNQETPSRHAASTIGNSTEAYGRRGSFSSAVFPQPRKSHTQDFESNDGSPVGYLAQETPVIADSQVPWPWDTRDMNMALDTRNNPYSEQRRISGEKDGGEYRPDQGRLHDSTWSGSHVLAPSQSYAYSRTVQPVTQGKPISQREEMKMADTDRSGQPGRYDVRPQQLEMPTSRIRNSVTPLSDLSGMKHVADREFSDPRDSGERHILEEETGELDVDETSSRRHGRRTSQPVLYGPQIARQLREAKPHPGNSRSESLSDHANMATNEPRSGLRHVSERDERGYVPPDQRASHKPVESDQFAMDKSKYEGKYSDRSQQILDSPDEADQSLQKFRDAATSARLSLLAQSFCQIIYLGKFKDCANFVRSHPEILQEDTDPFLRTAFFCYRGGQASFARSCIQQALLIRDCSALSRKGIDEYFRDLDRKKASALRSFQDSFDKLDQAVRSRLAQSR